VGNFPSSFFWVAWKGEVWLFLKVKGWNSSSSSFPFFSTNQCFLDGVEDFG